MTLRLNQESARRQGRSWKWSIWLEGPDTELDLVKAVCYQLHHSFRDPTHTITDRATRFRLSKSGWGEFAVYATVSKHDGSCETLQQWLMLEGFTEVNAAKDGDGRSGRPQVFISHSSADTNFAAQLHRQLENIGIRVVRAETIAFDGRPFTETLRDTIAEVPIGVVVSSENSSSWVATEAHQLIANSALIVPISLSPAPSSLEKVLRNLQVRQIKILSDEEELIRRAAQYTKELVERSHLG